MAKKILASVMAFALCLFVSAADMVIKGKNGEDRKINVVDQSETFLRFEFVSDSTVKLTKESSYRNHDSITIPEKVRIEGKVYTVTSIGYWAFYGCRSLTSINIPKGVTSIGMFTFKECSSLTSIKIPEGVTRIGSDAFRGCSNLDIVIDNSKKKVEVGSNAFKGCKSVTWLKD